MIRTAFHVWRETQPVRVYAACLGLPPKIGNSGVIRSRQPQHADIALAKYTHPNIKNLRPNLKSIVKRAKYKTIIRQSLIEASGSILGNLLRGIVAQVCSRQVNDPLPEQSPLMVRNDH